jgi:hypothetical protein
MSPLRLVFLVILSLSLLPLPLWGQPPSPLPVVGVPVGAAFAQPNPYDVWQVYGVDRTGRFRPVVGVVPGGAVRLLDGKPYYFMPTQQLDVVPVVADSLGSLPLQPAPFAPPVHGRRRWLR